MSVTSSDPSCQRGCSGGGKLCDHPSPGLLKLSICSCLNDSSQAFYVYFFFLRFALIVISAVFLICICLLYLVANLFCYYFILGLWRRWLIECCLSEAQRNAVEW